MQPSVVRQNKPGETEHNGYSKFEKINEESSFLGLFFQSKNKKPNNLLVMALN